MRTLIIILSCSIIFLSCEKEEESELYPPSVIEFEIQTYGDLSGEGTLFGSKQILTRETYDYVADDENGMHISTGFELDDGTMVQDLQGWGNDNHPAVKSLFLRIPDNGAGTYTFDADTSDNSHFFLRIESWGCEVRAGYCRGFFDPDKTNLTVTIDEVSETKMTGSFSGDLIYYIREESDNGITLTIDEEITNVNVPVINGTFEIYQKPL